MANRASRNSAVLVSAVSGQSPRPDAGASRAPWASARAQERATYMWPSAAERGLSEARIFSWSESNSDPKATRRTRAARKLAPAARGASICGNMDTYGRAHACSTAATVETAPGARSGSGWLITLGTLSDRPPEVRAALRSRRLSAGRGSCVILQLRYLARVGSAMRCYATFSCGTGH